MSANLPASTAQGAGAISFINQLSSTAILPLIVGSAFIVTLLVSLFMWASEPSYRPLYSNVAESDGGAIIAELDQRGVDYKVDDSSRSILVPSGEVHKLRLQLAEKGLPNTGNAGFDIIDKQKFGISQFAEQINYQRALEGELSQSIEELGPVSKARVHLAIAKPSVFARKNKNSKASVILTLHAGRELTAPQAASIAHMVSSSVPELNHTDVSIVDQNGNLLGQNSDQNGLSLTRLNYIQSVEEKFQKRVERILLPIFGPGNVRVQVNAEIDFTRSEQTEEQFKPNQGTDAASIRSAQLRARADEANNSSLTSPSGIAGALSNTPPGWMQSPITVANEPPADNTAAEDLVNVDLSNVVNYEVDRAIIHTKRQPGTINRLTAAVVVNHRESINDEGETVLEPIPQNELNQIESLIQESIGFSRERGDRIQLVNARFAKNDLVVDEGEIEWYENGDLLGLIDSLARYSFAFIGSLILYFVFLRPMLKKVRSVKFIGQQNNPELPNAAGALPAAGAVGGNGNFADDLAFDESGNFKVSTVTNEYAASYETALNEAKNLSESDPQVVALAIKDWINNS